MKIRAFLAFDIPKGVKQKLKKLVDDFAGKEKGVRWIDPEQMHVTMKFFGDIDEGTLLGDIDRAISSVTDRAEPLELKCSGIGAFPNWKYPKVIWAGFLGDVEPVFELKDKLESALAGFKIKKDERVFRLHLTVGRAKELKSSGKLMNLINELGPIDFGNMKIDHFTLYKSVLTREGSEYTVLKTYNFGKNNK